MAHFLTPEYIFTGESCIREAIPYFRQCGKKALLVTGPHVSEMEMFCDLTDMRRQENFCPQQKIYAEHAISRLWKNMEY